MRQLLFCDLLTWSLSSSSSGGSYTLPSLVAGQPWSFSLRTLQTIDGSKTEVQLPIASIKASIGKIDALPDGGQFKLQVGTGASTSANTTAWIDATASAETFAAALTALSVVTSEVTALAIDGSWIFWREDGAQMQVSVVGNLLHPVSFGRFAAVPHGNRWQHELRLLQTPLSFTDSATRILGDQPTLSFIQHGGTDESGVSKWNTIQRLDVPLNFRGTYELTRNFGKTILFSLSDGIDSIQAALNTLLATEQASCVVTLPDDGFFYIEFTGSLAGTDVELLGINCYASTPGDWTLTLPLDTAAMRAALRNQKKLTGIPFEIEAQLWKDPVDHSLGTTPCKLVQTTITLLPPLIWPELATVPVIDWQRPPTPQDYLAITTDQILTGNQQAVPFTLGDGVKTSFVCDHNLNSPLPPVFVRENISNGRLLQPSEFTVHFTSTNSLTISGFATTPTTNQYKAYIFAVGPASVFQSHTHTIAQITGLQTLLDSYSSAIATLNSILPTIRGAGVTAASGTLLTIPFGACSGIIGYDGPQTVPAAGFVPSALPTRAPSLLTAGNFQNRLWEVAVNDQMFALGCTLQADWGVALQQVSRAGETEVEYQLVVEQGTYTDPSSYLVVTWNSTPIFTQKILLTAELTTHSFGLTLTRGIVSGSDTIHLSQQIYGKITGNNAAAPTSANFALRCRLMNLKARNTTDPRGWVIFSLVPSLASASGATAAQATISTN